MQIRCVRMFVLDRGVCVAVAVGRARRVYDGIACGMRVLVMLVVNVGMLMLHRVMAMPVGVARTQRSDHASKHQAGTQHMPRRRAIVQ